MNYTIDYKNYKKVIPDNVESILIDDNFNENIDDITFPEKMSSIHF